MSMETVVLLQIFQNSYNFINNTVRSHSSLAITDSESNTYNFCWNLFFGSVYTETNIFYIDKKRRTLGDSHQEEWNITSALVTTCLVNTDHSWFSSLSFPVTQKWSSFFGICCRLSCTVSVLRKQPLCVAEIQ